MLTFLEKLYIGQTFDIKETMTGKKDAQNAARQNHSMNSIETQQEAITFLAIVRNAGINIMKYITMTMTDQAKKGRTKDSISGLR